MGFWSILGWLCILIIAGLVVSFLITPNSFSSFKNNVKGLFSSVTGQAISITEKKPYTDTKIQNKVKLTINVTDYFPQLLSCSTIKLNAQSSGVDENLAIQHLCENFCGNSAKSYGNYSYDLINWYCDKDKLYCNCG